MIGTCLFTVGRGELFDTIFFSALFVLGAIAFRNVNVLSVLLILMFFSGVQEIVWLIYLNDLFFKSIMYLVVIIIGSLLWYKTISKALIAFTLVIATTEIYWSMIGEERSVLLSFLMYVAAIHLLLLHFIYMRTEIFKKWGAKIWFIPLDWKIRDLAYFSYWFILAVALETYVTYWLKADFDLFYSAYPYVNHILSGILLWLLVEATANDFGQVRA